MCDTFLGRAAAAVAIVVATILNEGLEYFLFLVTMQGKELDLQYIQNLAGDVIYSVVSESCPFTFLKLINPLKLCAITTLFLLIKNGFQHFIYNSLFAEVVAHARALQYWLLLTSRRKFSSIISMCKMLFREGLFS